MIWSWIAVFLVVAWFSSVVAAYYVGRSSVWRYVGRQVEAGREAVRENLELQAAERRRRLEEQRAAALQITHARGFLVGRYPEA